MQQRAAEADEHKEAALESEEVEGTRQTATDALPGGLDLISAAHLLSTNLLKGASKPNTTEVQATGDKFLDSEFPPNARSLIENWEAADPQKQSDWKEFEWKRIDELFPQPIKVFNDISPNDILQGSLGDCYFLSALSAMAEFPQRIQRLFETSEYEPSGCYKVKIMDMGVWKEYVLDDYFPCTPEGTIAFSGPREEKGTTELWVMLLEKAWAKRFGCYYDIEYGFTFESLTDLTGAPCDVMLTSNPELWDKIFQGNQKNFIITAGSGGNTENHDQVDAMGLVSRHAYSIIDAQTVQTNQGPVNLLMIRNPWGKTEWQGDWSDTSPKWTPAIKEQLNWEPRDDGIFWMSMSDFCNFFTDVAICMVDDNYNQTAIQVNQAPGKFTVSQLSIRKAGRVYAIICQPDTRIFNDDPRYQYAPVRQILAKLNPDGSLTHMSGEAEAFSRDVWDVYELEPGEYLLYTEILWDGVFTSLHGVSLYAHHKLGLKDVTSTNQDFLQRVYNLEAAKRMCPTPRTIAPGVNYYNCVRYGVVEGKDIEGFIFDVVENTSTDEVQIHMVHSVFQNLELCEPFSGDMASFTVAPGESVSIIKKQVDLGGDTDHVVEPQVKRARIEEI